MTNLHRFHPVAQASRLCLDSNRRDVRSTTRRQPRRAFTLVEMVVVISIIVMLVGLTIGVSVILSRKSEERETESVLKLLDLAMTEWETAAERSPAPE
mgnify:CR=1 FL=1